jgi:DNA-binding PadR family transcriptional regulator
MANGLTELESCTLGVIGQRQPCSTYQVRQVFLRSTTPAWSGSAGAIYPVMERLIALGLVRVEGLKGDRRGRRNLSLTAAGRRAFSAWATTLEPGMGHATPDPIRTRATFFDLVDSPKEQSRFFARAEALTRDAIRTQQALVESDRRAGRLGDYVSSLGGLHQLEGRLKWLRKVRALLKN